MASHYLLLSSLRRSDPATLSNAFSRWCTTDLSFLFPFSSFSLYFFFVRLSRCSFPLEPRIVRRAQPYYLATSPFPVHCFNYPVARLIAFCASISVRRESIFLLLFLSCCTSSPSIFFSVYLIPEARTRVFFFLFLFK